MKRQVWLSWSLLAVIVACGHESATAPVPDALSLAKAATKWPSGGPARYELQWVLGSQIPASTDQQVDETGQYLLTTFATGGSLALLPSGRFQMALTTQTTCELVEQDFEPCGTTNASYRLRGTYIWVADPWCRENVPDAHPARFVVLTADNGSQYTGYFDPGGDDCPVEQAELEFVGGSGSSTFAPGVPVPSEWNRTR